MSRAHLLAIIATTACYQPSPPAGAPCASDGSCPPPLVCSQRNTCETSLDDATRLDVAIDTPPPPRDAMIDGPRPPIAWKATTTQTIPVSPNATTVTIAMPAHATGDVMIAVIAMGNTGQALAPMFVAPAGWTTIDQTDKGNDSAIATYWHVAGAAEPDHATWTFNELMEGTAWISVYEHVSTTTPIDAHAQLLINTAGPAYTSPKVTTTLPGAMLLASYAVHGSTTPTFVLPSGTTQRALLDDGTTRRGVGVEKLLATAGTTPDQTLTASVQQDYALVDVIALRPE